VNVLGPDRPESVRFGPFRTVSPFVRGSPDHSNNVQTGRRGWGVIGTARSHWLERTCARRGRAVKTEPTVPDAILDQYYCYRGQRRQMSSKDRPEDTSEQLV